MKRKIFLILISQIVIFLSINVIAEDLRLESLELKTYYPSPWGSYRELQVTDAMTIGQNADGTPLITSTPNRLLQVGGLSPDPCSIYGYKNDTSYTLYCLNEYDPDGVPGVSDASAICGISTADSDNSYGVKGYSYYGEGIYGSSQNGNGVYGFLPTIGPENHSAVYGWSMRENSIGVSGSSPGIGVSGFSTGASTAVGYGVKGFVTGIINDSAGVYGESQGDTAISYGVYGKTTSFVDNSCGVKGEAIGVPPLGVHSYGVYGSTMSSDGAGIYGTGPNFAGYFEGNLKVTGSTDFEHLTIRIVNDISEISSPVKGEVAFLRETGIIIFDGEWKKYDGTRIP